MWSLPVVMNWRYALEWQKRIVSGRRKWQEKTAIGNKSVWKDTAGQFFREWKDSMDGEVRKASDGHGLGTVWTRHSRLAALNYICLPPRPLTTWRLFFLRSVTASTVHSWARWTHGHMRKLFCSTACDELDNANDALRTFFGLGEWVWHSAIFFAVSLIGCARQTDSRTSNTKRRMDTDLRRISMHDHLQGTVDLE